MTFSDKATKLIDREIYIKGVYGTDINLLDYINSACKKACNIDWTIDNPPECECIVSRFYYNTSKLGEMEHSKEGLEWEKRMKNTWDYRRSKTNPKPFRRYKKKGGRIRVQWAQFRYTNRKRKDKTRCPGEANT